MVYLFKAQAGEKIPFSFDDEIDDIIENFKQDNQETANGNWEDYVEWSIEPLKGVTIEQAKQIFEAVWYFAGLLDPSVQARVFEK